MSRAGGGRAALVELVAAVLIAIPGLVLRLSGASPAPAEAAILYGLAIVGAAFLLTWAAELLEEHLGEGLAIAVLALVAVLPEYAVDVVFAWKAGKNPAHFAPLALANMTGANRLLIGVGWSLVALTAAWKARRNGRARADAGPPRGRAVSLAPVQMVGVGFLGVATLYAMTFALRRSLTFVDAAVLIGIFALYLVRLSRGRHDDRGEQEELEGAAVLIAALPPRPRAATMIAMLVLAALTIFLLAEPFATSLVATGNALKVNDFLLVQWVAPLASEAPEFIAAIVLARKGRSSTALGALVSSKINQWTLLVGFLPLVFALSSFSPHGLPLDVAQREELLLTASQSFFALVLVLEGRLGVGGAVSLLTLFLAQFALSWALPASLAGPARLGFSALYIVAGLALLAMRRAALVAVVRSSVGPAALAKRRD
ncbi:MAG: sodium:proton exchanger [Actinomycetota bacterium]|nr:sodium:proton exchanger [Actinomycetota bacterium]